MKVVHLYFEKIVNGSDSNIKNNILLNLLVHKKLITYFQEIASGSV